MAAAQRKLVHKQFNSPMGLYSAQNVKETLNRELKAFGNDGIEVDEQILKPANLSNSAVLKALEEDEMEIAYPGYKRVAWPPVGESRTYREYTPQPQLPQQQQQHHPQESTQQQLQQQNQNVTNQPFAQKIYQSVPVDYHQQPSIGSSYNQQQQGHQYQEIQNQSPQPDNQYNNIYSLQQQPQQQYSSQAYRGESPGIITLRKETPVTQTPSPVYTSQPAAASFRGGSNMRGDLKWPPPEYKAQAQEANEERRKLALGPVFRPRRVNKDYTQFFAKNAINNYYPTYKVPPGTQHVVAEY